MPEIRTLVSSEVHEPKHISDSTSADAGKVITPLSGGTSELRNLTPAEVGVKTVFGEIAVNANTASFSVAAAADATLQTTTDYVQLNSVRLPSGYFDHSNGVTFNSVTNSLTPSVSGIYRISLWLNITTDTNNTKIGVKLKDNGSWASFTLKQDIASLGRVENISGSLLEALTTDNEMSLWVASDKSANITIQDARFCIELLQEI